MFKKIDFALFKKIYPQNESCYDTVYVTKRCVVKDNWSLAEIVESRQAIICYVTIVMRKVPWEISSTDTDVAIIFLRSWINKIFLKICEVDFYYRKRCHKTHLFFNLFNLNACLILMPVNTGQVLYFGTAVK